MSAVADFKASSSDPFRPMVMMWVGVSTRRARRSVCWITSTVNSTSMEVSSALPLSSPSP